MDKYAYWVARGDHAHELTRVLENEEMKKGWWNRSTYSKPGVEVNLEITRRGNQDYTQVTLLYRGKPEGAVSTFAKLHQFMHQLGLNPEDHGQLYEAVFVHAAPQKPAKGAAEKNDHVNERLAVYGGKPRGVIPKSSSPAGKGAK